MMLRTEKFDGDTPQQIASCSAFLEALGAQIGEFVVPIDGKPIEGACDRIEAETSVAVQFLDTADFRIRNRTGYVLRQRTQLEDGTREVTLKFRHRDRFLASRRDTTAKDKFEEDIKATTHEPFISLSSLSDKIEELETGQSLKRLEDLQKLYPATYPHLASEFELSDELLVVNDLTATQTVIEGANIRLTSDPEVDAECAMILWHKEGSQPDTPLVAEFSYRYKDKKLGKKEEPFGATLALRSYQVLQALRGMDDWIDLEGPTKTAFAYHASQS